MPPTENGGRNSVSGDGSVGPEGVNRSPTLITDFPGDLEHPLILKFGSLSAVQIVIVALALQLVEPSLHLLHDFAVGRGHSESNSVSQQVLH